MVVGMAEAGQNHDEPLHEEDRRTPSPGHCGRDLTYGESTPADGMMALMDRIQAGRFLEQMAVCWACLAHVAGCRSPKGPTFCLLDAGDAQKGPTSPSEGPDVSHFSSILTFLAFK